jgi:hypothetical protein
MQPVKQILTPVGRPKFSRNAETLSPKRIAGLVGASRETLADGRLLMTLERVSFVLGLSLQATRYLVMHGIIPSVAIPEPYGDSFRSTPKVPAESLLQWARKQYPEML